MQFLHNDTLLAYYTSIVGASQNNRLDGLQPMGEHEKLPLNLLEQPQQRTTLQQGTLHQQAGGIQMAMNACQD